MIYHRLHNNKSKFKTWKIRETKWQNGARQSPSLFFLPHPPFFHPGRATFAKQFTHSVVLLQGKGKVTIVLSINFDTFLQRLINYFWCLSAMLLLLSLEINKTKPKILHISHQRINGLKTPSGRVFLLLPQCSWYLQMQVTDSQRAKTTIPHLQGKSQKTFYFQVF